MTRLRRTPLLAILAVGLAMSACSSPLVHVSVPAGWKPVSYSGLTIDVPGSWPVYQRSLKDCGITGAGVLVGTMPPGQGLCPSSSFRGVVLTFGGPDTVAPVGAEKRENLNGVEAAISEEGVPPSEGGDVALDVVRFPGRNVWLSATVPGRLSAGVLGVVDQVVRTVRPSK